MTKVVHFSEAEVAESSDWENASLYAREGDEAIVGGAIGYPHHWAGHSISQTSAIEIAINPGALFTGGIVYRNEQPISVNLQLYLPLVTGDRRYVALLLRGEEKTEQESRLFEVDADTEETVERMTPKTGLRQIVCVVQQGLTSPTPVKPVVAADQCCLGFVELSTTGIVAIEMDNARRVKTLYELDGRVEAVEADQAATNSRVKTLETDVANIASRLGDIPSPVVMRQIKRDVATFQRRISMPDEARAYGYDSGLVQDWWDKNHPSWLARIREGIRFPWAAERDAQLALIDETAPDVRFHNRLLMPAWTETMRLAIDGDGGSINISQQVHTEVSLVRREVSRTVTEVGETTTVCENNREWANYVSRAEIGALFTKNGETWQILDNDGGRNYGRGHVFYTVGKLIQRTVTDVYWDEVTEQIGVNGSIYGQTWLCSQPMILTSVDLCFTRAATAGDVHLFICECDGSGAPRLDAVIANTTIAAALLTTGWNKFSIRPSPLESGKRYAWFTVTTGNHALETVSGNKFAQGSQFHVTDGAWAQGSTTVDFAMRLNAASFASTRTVVEFQPLILENGMTDIRLLHAGWTLGGTALTWEIRPSDADEWRPLNDTVGERTPLAGLPPLVRLRAVFTGTTDLQPAIILDAYARGMTFRPRGDMQAVSIEHQFGLSSQTIQVEAVIDQYDPQKHTVAPKLIAGGTVLTPTTCVITPDLVSDKKKTWLATYLLAQPATSARARLDMTTTEVTDIPFIQNIAYYAL
ncbi:hypothetical protein [Rhodomicrobium sp.]|uniref:hypothetical protein n=1 Tax=Rhodomicrobium sp. TaxID=2720632 RepID=UPI0039E22E75